MAYSGSLETRIDRLAADWGLSKKNMFGGLSYMLDGSMAFAVRDGELLFRVEATVMVRLLKQDGIYEAVMGPRVMKRWLQANSKAIADDRQLLALMEISRDYSVRHKGEK